MVHPRHEVRRYQCDSCHSVKKFVQQGCIRLPDVLNCDKCGGRLQLLPDKGLLQRLVDGVRQLVGRF